MSKLFRLFFRTLGRLLMFLIGAMAVGCLVPQSCSRTTHCGQPVTVYFVNHGYHTGIAVPTVSPMYDWRRDFPSATGSTLMEFGWGDKDFYMSRGFPIGVGLKALFMPNNPAVMHVVALSDRYSSILSNAEVTPVSICPEQYTAMVQYIRTSFQRDSLGHTKYLSEGFFGTPSGFYDATGAYYCFNNCNTWVGGSLRAAGLRTPLWDGIPQSIRWHLPDTTAQ